MSYVDGFVGAVPIANKDAYTKLASISADVFRECGALSVIEAWGDDLPEGKINSMHTAVLRKPASGLPPPRRAPRGSRSNR